MEKDTKRITFSPPSELAAELASAKEGRYAGRTQGEMFQDLILRGLQTWRSQSGQDGQPPYRE